MGPDRLGPKRLWAELVWGRIDLIPIYFGNIEINLNSDLNDKDAMIGTKIVISEPLLYRRPLLLRQLKNNQNQTNTTGAQNLKEFNNTAGWLSVFIFVSCNELIK